MRGRVGRVELDDIVVDGRSGYAVGEDARHAELVLEGKVLVGRDYVVEDVIADDADVTGAVDERDEAPLLLLEVDHVTAQVLHRWDREPLGADEALDALLAVGTHVAPGEPRHDILDGGQPVGGRLLLLLLLLLLIMMMLLQQQLLVRPKSTGDDDSAPRCGQQGLEDGGELGGAEATRGQFGGCGGDGRLIL